MEQLADSPGFRHLRAEIILLADLHDSDCVLDIGAGTGLLTLAAAGHVSHVTALDISGAMCRHLENKLVASSIDNVDVLTGNASELPLSDASIDVILSNYCFHHLRDPDKRRALSEAVRVLRPGGRFVAGDMMFQIGLRQARDRAVIARFAGQMLRRGPAGVTRLLKNLLRHGSGRGEHPAGVSWWREALYDAGFVDVDVRTLRHEGAIATGRLRGQAVRRQDTRRSGQIARAPRGADASLSGSSPVPPPIEGSRVPSGRLRLRRASRPPPGTELSSRVPPAQPE